jgi:hypothetical protein
MIHSMCGEKCRETCFKSDGRYSKYYAVIVNLLKPTGYGMHQQVEYFNNCTLCPYCMCFVFV